MRRFVRRTKSSKRIVIVTMVTVIMLALLLQVTILSFLNKKNGARTTTLITNQVIDILERNKKAEKELIDSLKEEYKIRAKVIDSILQEKPHAEFDVMELKSIASLVGVDEIHFFDETGTIYSGTVHKYYGISMDSGEQVGYFKPMLSDKTLSMCQDVTPNTAENKNMMYAIIWSSNGKYMIQVGIEPVRLLEVLKNNSIQNVIAGMPVYEGVSIYLSENNTGKIVGATEPDVIGGFLIEQGIDTRNFDLTSGECFTANIRGYRNFVKFDLSDKYLLTVAYSTAPHVETFVISLLIILVFLLVAAIVIFTMVSKEEQLLIASNTDELTGIYNRRAYEDFIAGDKDTVFESDFVYVAMDVNGLKIVNDTLGHAAGDELIVGTAQCMKLCFGSYGQIYRIGGDEFAAIIFASSEQLKKIKVDFEQQISQWTGRLIDHISVSAGYVSADEVETASIHDMSLIAEKRMYEAKSAFYRKKGFDRRGQQNAHTALCSLYTKILKINLTSDSYQIVNMDQNEQMEDKGFSDKISDWLKNFGTSGQVHPDDLEEYLNNTSIDWLRKYFKGRKSSLNIFYRRMIDGVYRKVMLEMIPANDYSDDDQSLFLYVKDIEG